MRNRENRLDRLVIKYIVLVAILFAIVLNYDAVISYVTKIVNVLSPVIFGFMIAFILNLIMSKIEEYWFPDTDNSFLNQARRPIAILLSLLIVMFIIGVILWLIIPQLISAIRITIEAVPTVISYIQSFLANLEENFPEYNSFVSESPFNWERIVSEFTSFANGLIESLFSVVSNISSSAFNLVVIIVVSVYALFSKERIIYQFDRVARAYLSKNTYRKTAYVFSVINESFSSFMSGMLIEAVIYGAMVTVGMWIFRFPYAAMVGTISGALALIPMFGAILSAAIGILLVLTNSISQAFFFLIFIIFVQQLESNVIYPRVVGSTIGLPGIWTFIAVTVGGGLFGVFGFFIGVPIASALYKLLRKDVEYRENIGISNVTVLSTNGQISAQPNKSEE